MVDFQKLIDRIKYLELRFYLDIVYEDARMYFDPSKPLPIVIYP